MTFRRDPPRLRTLGAALPDELSRALEPSAEEDAAAEALARVEEALHARLNAAAASSRGVGGESSTPARRRQRAVSRRTAGLALTFAIGAAAGVLVAGGAFVVQRMSAEPRKAPDTQVGQRAVPAVAAGRRPLSREAAESGSAAPSASEAIDVPPPAPPSIRSREGPSVESAPVTFDRTAETAILTRAQAALDTDAGRALALTSDHERRFPDGVLAQEREVIAIEALIRLGRRAEAKARAEAFHRRYPSSVHGRRIDVLLAEGSSSPSDHN